MPIPIPVFVHSFSSICSCTSLAMSVDFETHKLLENMEIAQQNHFECRINLFLQ